MNYQYLFGPVPSRRLWVSLGIDLIPYKICSLNCVYCECGETTLFTNERKEYIPTADIINELKDYLINIPRLDFITFSGSGEPTLHSGIGQIIAFLKNNYPEYKIALLTNSSLLYDSQLQLELNDLDIILPSLDAVSEDIFQKINRARPDIKNQKIIEGLIKFCEKFTGTIWVEIFIIPGINDHGQELKLLKEVLLQINPDQVQLNTIDRPGTESWVKKPSYDRMNEIKDFFKPLPTIIIGKYQEKEKVEFIKQQLTDTILSTISRRPCTLDDLMSIANTTESDLKHVLKVLIDQKKIEKTRQVRGFFYKIKKNCV
jgi:wyosine [tRNA(Phe)-imidazoG37] synthetase (radical SAM superfamily)